MKLPYDLNADFIDAQYLKWKLDPSTVSDQWRFFFEGFELASTAEKVPGAVCDIGQVLKQSRVDELVYRYRDLGHLLACLDPLLACPTDHPLLSLNAFQLDADDLDTEFYTPQIGDRDRMPLRDIVSFLRETYCHSIGVEYLHLQDPDERGWLQERMEPIRNRPRFEPELKLRILNKLCQATLFEQFLHTKYLGQKRFSIEGAESVVAMLDVLIDHAALADYREIILAMAHRGRLNVQVNVLNKLYEAVFCSFEDNYNPEALVGSGDVKYHQGYMTELQTRHDRAVSVLMPSNASHLESVDPIAEGIARRRQEQFGEDGIDRVLPVLIHGDAAFAGQGVVFETLNLSQLEGYHTGGTIHLVINNQIGFTALPEDARSTRYSTDVAKMLMVPIFHVHGEDPEAVAHVAQLACDYRSRFHKDVVIDLVCYRRYGHNEGDEPSYTQPQMYERIRERKPAYEIYAGQCIAEAVTTAEAVEEMKNGIDTCLQSALESARGDLCLPPESHFYDIWGDFTGKANGAEVATGCAKESLIAIAQTIFSSGADLSINRKLERILKRRLDAIESGEGIDWPTAELLAFGSLLLEGHPVRLSGQDSRRGTFSQRHSVLTDSVTGEHDVPLNRLPDRQASFQVFDSALSENAVLGFEYGYSLASPEALVLWEAQFGDFANNAQVIIDQYIAAAEAKWKRWSGLVMLLPHGFEGQGPEHSSARLERYLQLCAEDNLQVCVATTPAQYFHLLRRQVKESFRKPLIVLTPKSLLRHPQAVSRLSDLTAGSFQEVLDDPGVSGAVRRVLVCTGKIYYDLLQEREQQQHPETAIVRLEQLYPWDSSRFMDVMGRFAEAEEVIWVQEEPRNMGAWVQFKTHLEEALGQSIRYLGRAPAASPATGFLRIHKQEQQRIVEQALGNGGTPVR